MVFFEKQKLGINFTMKSVNKNFNFHGKEQIHFLLASGISFHFSSCRYSRPAAGRENYACQKLGFGEGNALS
jgi:hypothetical protein